MLRIAKEGTLGIKHCAFCKFFYDPCNTVISPKRGSRDHWEYDAYVKKYCRFWKGDRQAQSSCSHFDCKL